jgi:TPR repeat protein
MTGTKPYRLALQEMRTPKPDKAKAFELLTEALNKNDPYAAYAIATWYLFGVHVRKNYAKGVGLLEIAAEKNIPSALFDLAVSCETGKGIKVNKKRAYELYVRAALWGDKQATYEVGRCLCYGIGTPRNLRFADIWLYRAETLGIVD